MPSRRGSLLRTSARLEAYLADASPVRDGPAIRVVGAVLAEDAATLGAFAGLRGN